MKPKIQLRVRRDETGEVTGAFIRLVLPDGRYRERQLTEWRADTEKWDLIKSYLHKTTPKHFITALLQNEARQWTEELFKGGA